jgi:CheY-like chemotaxis protein
MQKNLLIVDDEPSFTRMVKRTLELTGRYRVRTENRGEAAIEAAREMHPDLILLDVMMPDVDGPEVAARLRDDPGLRHIPVVFLTAIVTKEETSATGSEIAGNPFLAKPVGTEDLIACIEEHLA